eukprot:3317611-Pleurochrysis_carterae.AAC.1
MQPNSQNVPSEYAMPWLIKRVYFTGALLNIVVYRFHEEKNLKPDCFCAQKRTSTEAAAPEKRR